MNHYLNDLSSFSINRKKMYFSWKPFFVLLFSCFVIFQIQAQSSTVNVEGIVIDEKGQAVIGANITIKGTTLGTITNVEGNFQLKATIGSVLKISYIGYLDQEIKVEENKLMKIQLEEDSKTLSEVVVVGYGQQKKVSVVGSISTTSGKDLVKSPQGSLGNAMVGRLNGLVSVQETGIPGGETPRINIRGVSTLNNASPLVIVDGVERTGGGRASGDPKDISGGTMGNVSGWEAINPNDVESISVLKDASATAVYGVKGANGVIIITTKRGKTGKPVVSYSFNYGLSNPTSLKQTLNSYETIRYSNEANSNDGLPQIKSYDDMNNYRYHTNDLLYPDMNINKYMLLDYSPKSSHNFSISGGSELVKYFCSAGYYDESGLVKQNSAYGFDPNNKYNRTNVRSNLDFQFTKRLSASINIDARYEERQGARNPGNNIFWTQMYMSLPWTSPGFNENGHMIISNTPTADGYPIFVAIQSGGMYKREQITANTLFSAKYDLDQITKGLSVASRFSFDSYSESWFNTTQAHARVDIGRDPVTNEPISIKSGFDGEMIINRQAPDKRKKYYFETSLNYSRTFGNHNVTALALYNQEKRHYFETSFPDVPVAYIGFVSRLTYDYKSRYFAEFNLGINGSENFPVGQRFGTFPAFSAGWLLTDEPFMKNVKAISSFKFRASYGEVGSDRIGNNRFLYIPGNYVNFPEQYVGLFGEGNNIYGGSNGIRGVQEGSAANQNVTWETARKTNIGFDSKFFKDRLSLVLDLFQEDRDNILTNMETLPGFLFPNFPDSWGPSPLTKSYTTPVNYAKVQNRGIEIELGWNDFIGKDFNYFGKLTMAYSKNKAVLLSESRKDYPWLYNQGLPLQMTRGLIAEGYWNSYAEINNLNNPYNTYGPNPIPGDVKYKDINGDMKIDNNDLVPLDYSAVTPRTNFAGSFGFSYKGFDVSLLFQGVTGMIYMPSGYSQKLGARGAVFDWISDRWTPNNRNGNYPVLHTFSASSSNFVPSTYWAYDDTYVRLKNVQVGYVIPKQITSKLAISNLRVSITAQNLATWTLDDRMKNYDPEAWSGGGGVESYYPIMKIFNLGIDVTF
ncbi:MAG: TonB-dependent receptor [Paludibacter sp.]|nr:TonB-dependent receptor [Paludibacter sp.]